MLLIYSLRGYAGIVEAVATVVHYTVSGLFAHLTASGCALVLEALFARTGGTGALGVGGARSVARHVRLR